MEEKYMRPLVQTVGPRFFLLAFFCTIAVLPAQETAPVDRVTRTGGQTFAVRAGKSEELTDNLALSGDIKVTTNGTFHVGAGKERVLQEGQALDRDGTLHSPDGSVGPVADHAAMKKGVVVVVKDGQPAPLRAPMTLADGTKISPDGTVVAPSGGRTKLLDGQLLKLDGTSLKARDTVSLQGGKVVVQKDGSQLPVAPGRSVMMSDGTKVSGDGVVIKRDGTKVKLTEGQTLTIDGVVRR